MQQSFSKQKENLKQYASVQNYLHDIVKLAGKFIPNCFIGEFTFFTSFFNRVGFVWNTNSRVV
jgi:hypothetical protein